MFTLRNVLARSVALCLIVGIQIFCFGFPRWFDSHASIGHDVDETVVVEPDKPMAPAPQ